MTILLYVPFSNKDDAENIARKALEAHLVACVNFIPHVTSMYRWPDGHGQEDIVSSMETVALFKTSYECVEKLRDFIQEHHPYDCPAILKISVEENATFREWVNTQCHV